MLPLINHFSSPLSSIPIPHPNQPPNSSNPQKKIISQIPSQNQSTTPVKPNSTTQRRRLEAPTFIPTVTPMWPLRRINTPPWSPRTRSFSCSSFKDIQSLCDDDPWQPDSHSPIASPRSCPSVFHRFRIPASARHHSSFALRHANSLLTASNLSKIPEKPITVYFTSLRVVRKTFEDCRAVRSILRGYRVPIDERDLSMDSQYVAELQGILGCRNGKGFAIPCVFVGRCCVVGAEEVNRLHDSGELRAMIAGAPPPGTAALCGACGGMRYVVCEQCHGSRKIYVDKSGFRSCNACNVNGLARCSRCMGL